MVVSRRSFRMASFVAVGAVLKGTALVPSVPCQARLRVPLRHGRLSSGARAQRKAGPSVVERLSDRVQRVAGVSFFVAVDLKLKAAGITTPIVGMLAVFGSLMAMQVSLGTKVSDKVFRVLEPGYRFLVKWASLFFVPALVKLPLSWNDIGVAALPRLAVLLVVGFLGTILSCIGMADSFGPGSEIATKSQASSNARPYPRPGAPFKKRWLPFYLVVMALSMLAARLGITSQVAAQCAYMLCASCCCFAGAQAAPSQVKAFLHPLFATIFGSWIAAALWASQAAKIGFFDVLVTYSSWPGAGALISTMLGPAVVALALVLYERRALLAQEWVPIVCTSAASAVTSLFGTAALARAIGLPKALGLASVSRCVTSAIAADMASTLGASQTLAIAMVVITGFLGAAVGPGLLRLLKIKSARTRGLSMAASAHGLGMATVAGYDEEALPYSAVGFVLVAAASTILVQIAPVRAALLWTLGI